MAKRTRRAVEEGKKDSTSGIDNFYPTKEQKTAINTARSNTLSFVIGPPGTGKSSAIMWDYCKEYLANPSKQIVVVKSPTEAGQLDKIGYLKGDLSDKLEAHFVSNRKILEEFLGRGKLECDLGKRIHFLVPNFLLGQTLNDCLILVEECYTPGHELLTPDGWKLIEDVTVEDQVYQYHKDGTGSFVNPVRVINKDYCGNIYTSTRRSVKYAVTENHDMVYHSPRTGIVKRKASHKPASDEKFIQRTILPVDSEYPISDAMIELSVALQADGNCQVRDNNNCSWQVQISKDKKIKEFERLMAETGYFHQVKGNSGKNRYYEGSFETPLVSNTADKKFCLNTLLSLSVRQRVVFLNALEKWDGSTYNSGKSSLYSSTSKHNIDVVQAVAHLTGWVGCISVSVDNRKESYKDYYKIHFSNKESKVNSVTSKDEVSHYKGKVHCVTVPSGMILVRKDGCVHVNGNCQQLQPMLMKLILERTGQNSRVCALGDPLQLYTDSKESRLRNGLTDAVSRFFDPQGSPLYPDVGMYKFSSDSVVRSEIVKTVIKAYYDE